MTDDMPTLHVRGASVFDSDTRSFVADLDVLVSEGTIAAIGRALLSAPGVTRVDGTGLFCLPGLIDCHVHLVSNGDPGALVAVQSMTTPTQTLHATKNAADTLSAGVTTVRDLGSPGGLAIDLAAGVESGLVDGPNIVASGMGVTMTGGHGHGFLAEEADGPDEVRKAVRKQLRAGARAIKLFASGGVMTPGVDPRSPSFTEDELRAGVEEAHKAFRSVGAHAQATDGIKNAIRAGVDSIEHGVWIDDEAIELMAERGTWLVPTLSAPHHIYYGGEAAGIPPYMIEKAHQVLEDHIASFRKAVSAGVKVAMGTDQGTPLNRAGENAQEALRMAANGLSNEATLLASTLWAAQLLRVDDKRGSLRPGLAADMLVLNRDPLADISVLADRSAVVAVLREGRVVRQSEGWRLS